MVTELLTEGKVSSDSEMRFTNPRESWAFLSGGDRMTLDDGDIPLAQTGSGAGGAMRYLPAGEHQVRVEGPAEGLAVRAIPELIFCKYQYDPHVRPHGPYDWAFLETHVLGHVNCVVGNRSEAQRRTRRGNASAVG